MLAKRDGGFDLCCAAHRRGRHLLAGTGGHADADLSRAVRTG
jgi:hypothetical protein